MNDMNLDIFATAAYRIINDYYDITLYRPAEDGVHFMANPKLRTRGWKRRMTNRLVAIRARAAVRRDGDGYHITVSALPPGIGRPPLLNVLLFVLTFLTVLLAATTMEVGAAFLDDLSLLARGIPFTLSLLTILLVHEMGHFWAGHRRGVVMSYPFFIPAPTFLGTFGALIRSRTPIRNKNDLILIGAAGPLAGAVPALIALVYGYTTSQMVTLPSEPVLMFGNSLATLLVQNLFFSDIPAGMGIQLSPIALAGQVGLLVTMLNLLPLGQLDGGHVVYGLLGKRQHKLAALFLACLFMLGFIWKGWWIWLALAVIMRPFHPPVIEDGPAPDFRHKKIGWAAVILFILTFVPMPIY